LGDASKFAIGLFLKGTKNKKYYKYFLPKGISPENQFISFTLSF
jgi:hypothetical protein